MNILIKPILAFCSLMLLSSGTTVDANEFEQEIETKVVSADQSHITPYEGSQFNTYFIGQTVGTKNAIAGVATIEPNNEIHPAHEHEEEEYLLILEGSGEWELDGKKFSASSGDMLYVAPGIKHGLFNSGSTVMKFAVWKWSSKGDVTSKERK